MSKTNFLTVRFRDCPQQLLKLYFFCYDHIVSTCTLARQESTVHYGETDVKSSKVIEYP